MELSKLLFLFISTPIFALSVLNTKQASRNLRYISQDSKIVYFQKSSSGLYLSQNFKNKRILSGDAKAHFTITASPLERKLIVSESKSFHQEFRLDSIDHLYQINLDGTDRGKIGEGVAPKLHLNDSWVSFFRPFEQTLHFVFLSNPDIDFSIDLTKKKNKTFIPQVVMLSETSILFTDENKEGKQTLTSFSRTTQNRYQIYVSPSRGVRFELCFNKKLYFAQFGTMMNRFGSSLYQLSNLNQINFNNFQSVYDSEFEDRGKLICHYDLNDVYFVKNIKNQTFEVASLNTQSKKINILTNKKFVSQIFLMGNRIILPFQGKFYVVQGDANTIKDGFNTSP